MAEELQAFSFTPEGGSQTNSNKDFTGKGAAVYQNGDIYEGEYLAGKRNGKGVYKYSNGDKYEGEFRENRKNGIGKAIYQGKGEYYGQWENGKRHGEGLFTYINKDVYSGFWWNGMKHGKGTYVFSDTGMRYQGNYYENKLVDGKWIFPNGTTYEGPFEHNKPCGNGQWSFKNKNKVEGQYTQIIVPNANIEDKTLNFQIEWTRKIKEIEN